MGQKSRVLLITTAKEAAFLQLPYAVLLFLMNEARFWVKAYATEAGGGAATEFSICKLT